MKVFTLTPGYLTILKKSSINFVLPLLLIVLSKFNEQFYLQPEHKNLMPLYFIKVLLFFFGMYLSIRLQGFIIKYQLTKKFNFTHEQKAFFLIFLWFMIWYGFWLFVYYPGSYITDTIDIIKQLSFMDFHDWFSYLHPLLYLFLYQFYPHIVVIGISQILLYAFVLADILSYFYANFKMHRKLKIFFFVSLTLFISSITSITYYTFFYMRDIPYAALHLYFAFMVFKLCVKFKTSHIPNRDLCSIIILGLILSIYRGESLIVLVTSLFALLLYGLLTIKQFLKIILVSMSLFLFLNFLLPHYLGIVSSNKNHYRLTLIAYPLGFILKEKNNYISQDHNQDKTVLSKVINIDSIQKYTNCYDILAFQYEGNHWNEYATEEEWKQFYKRVYPIFWNNLHLFFAARTANFFAQLLAPKYKAERENDEGRHELTYQKVYDECKTTFDNSSDVKQQKWCEKYDNKMLTALKTIPECLNNAGICGNSHLMLLNLISFDWHWNSMFAFFASIIVLCLYKYLPMTAITSAIILSRILLIYLTAPYAFFRYVYSLYLFGLFILLFVWYETTSKCNSALRSKA